MNAPVLCRHGDECVGWLDGTPPLFALAPDDASVRQALSASFPAQPTMTRERELKLILILSPDWVPPSEQVLAAIGARQPASVRIVIKGYDPLFRWDAVSNLIRGVLRTLRSTGSPLPVTFEIETSLSTLPVEILDVLERILSWSRVVVIDTACKEVSAETENASSLADSGIRLSARMHLSGNDPDLWRSRAEHWRVLVRNGDLGFCRPLAPRQASCDSDALLPEQATVTSFLQEILDSHRFDLWRTSPFSKVLCALCDGLASCEYCGSRDIIAITRRGTVSGCQYGVPICPHRRAYGCECEYSLFCDVVHANCPGQCNDKTERARWGRLFCPALNLLLPRILSSLGDAVANQRWLARGESGQRVRIAAREGKPLIWSEQVVTDHRNRFEEADNGNRNPYDLSGIRTRIASSDLGVRPAADASSA